MDGVSKLSSRPKGDHVTHFWGWIKIFILRSLIWKCSYANDTIKGGPMMLVSSTIDGNKKARGNGKL